jgi:hypothetical protein
MHCPCSAEYRTRYQQLVSCAFRSSLFCPWQETRNRKLPWRMPSSGMLRRVALVRTDVSKETIASIVRVTRIGDLGTTLPVTSIRNTRAVVPSSPGLVTLIIETVIPKRPFLQQPYGVTSQKTAFLIVNAVKTSNLTDIFHYLNCIMRIAFASLSLSHTHTDTHTHKQIDKKVMQATRNVSLCKLHWYK